jgi:hypothetical protein
MAASGTHPRYSATTPVAAPVGPEPPSRLVQLSEGTTSLPPRADGQRAAVPGPVELVTNRGIWPQMGNGFSRYGAVWVTDLADA